MDSIQIKPGLSGYSVQHDLDEECCCKRCGFDAAEWWHLKRSRPESVDAKMPPCEHYR